MLGSMIRGPGVVGGDAYSVGGDGGSCCVFFVLCGWVGGWRDGMGLGWRVGFESLLVRGALRFGSWS